MQRAFIYPVSKVNDECLRNLLKYQIIPAPDGFKHICAFVDEKYEARDKTVDEIYLQRLQVKQEIYDMEKLSFIFNNYSVPNYDHQLIWQSEEILSLLALIIERYVNSLYRGWEYLLDHNHSKFKQMEKKRAKRLRNKTNKKNRD